MRHYSIKIAIFVLMVFLSSSAVAQDRKTDFPASLTIEQVITQLKEANLYPIKESEITIAGYVLYPGFAKFQDSISLDEAFAACGGITRNATGTARIIKKGSGGKYDQNIFIEIKKVRLGQETYSLQSGDIVIVLGPKTEFPNQIPDSPLRIKLLANQV